MENDFKGLLNKRDLQKILGISSRELGMAIRLGIIPVAIRLSRKTMYFDPAVIEKFKVEQNGK
jgi:hypothetical protein